MKWLIYILLLANLSMFVWHYKGSNTSSVNIQDPAHDIPKLVLLRDIFGDDRHAVNSLTEFNNRMHFAAVPHCYRIGPMDSKNTADQAVEDLARQGIIAKSVSHKDTNKAGFWVFLPRHNTRQAANQSIRKLKANGEKDYFLVASGEFKNAVSLGLFSKRHLANIRLDKIKAMGFAPAMQNVNLPKSLYWLEWERDPENVMSREVFIYLRRQYKNIGQIEIRCSIAEQS